MNARQQITSATHGSNLNSTFSFDSYGYPSSASTGSIRSYNYSFNGVTGNLSSRRNVEISTTEEFTYDNLDRLLTATGGQSLTMTYNANGNIATKNDLGSASFGYNNTSKPYVLTDIEATTGLISDSLQTATYTSFEQVSSIDEGDYLATFTYNSDGQRAKMLVTELGSTILTRWYVGSRYIKETEGNTTRQYTWLGGDAYTAPVVAVTQSGTTTYYYLLRDHLGTITHLVNTSNTVVSKYSFDAWGRRRVADDWEDYDVSSEPDLFAGRGFTAHEYLPWFDLYNMNGRLYDPMVGRFLNPDPYIQNPGLTQNYNRYSYCLNNPLKYVDPSGYDRMTIETPWLNPYADKLFDTGRGSGGGDGSSGGGSSCSWYMGTIFNPDGSINYGGPSNETVDAWLDSGLSSEWTLGGFSDYYNSGVEIILESRELDWTRKNGQPYLKGVILYYQVITAAKGATEQGGMIKYEGSIPDIITIIGGNSSIYSNHIKYVAPIINQHYKSPKYWTIFGAVGNIGDAAATLGAGYNLTIDPNNPESYTDMITAIIGWWPVVGDINAILYMGIKDQVYQIQDNIKNNVNTLQNIYVPATGDVLWLY